MLGTVKMTKFYWQLEEDVEVPIRLSQKKGLWTFLVSLLCYRVLGNDPLLIPWTICRDIRPSCTNPGLDVMRATRGEVSGL